MESAYAPSALVSTEPPVWRFEWLTPLVCRLIFAAVVAYGFFSGWHFLTHQCPIDLSGDEAQYWDWSRHLDLSYYSKGPLIAYLIRASCLVFGNTMPGVRFPALVLAVGTSICTYWLTLKLFGSDRLALGTFLLGGIVPMYAAGSTLMTIDPPFFFFWAAATCLAVKGVLDRATWAWWGAGVMVGLGFLAKYAMYLWLPFLFLFLIVDPASRPLLKTSRPWVLLLIALAFSAPVMIWNAEHHWVSLHHVATQTGTNKTGGMARGNLLEFVGSQVGIVNPAIAVMLVAAIIYTFSATGRTDRNSRSLRYLISIGLPFFGICLLDSFRSKVQPNWPAPAYFTLLILTAYFISTRMSSRAKWKPWRGWFYAAVVFGLIVQPVLKGSTALYPLVSYINKTFPRKTAVGTPTRPRLLPANFDIVFKLRGVEDPLASTVSAHLSELPVGSFILCEDYQDSSQLAFYARGQPKTYFVGSYWSDPLVRRRRTQFDMWPDRDLDRPELIGKDAIYVGLTANYAPLRESFDRIEELPEIVIRQNGMILRTVRVWRCIGFHGIAHPSGEGAY